MATAHELPDLPSLAPLAVSSNQDPSTPGPVKPAMLKTKDSSHFLKSPALSFAESFSTAYTSPSPRDDLSQLDLSSLAPPQSLRKSVSVDSFAHYGREGARNNSSGCSPVSPEIEGAVPIDAQITLDPSSSRHRGESFSSVHNDHDIEGDDNRSETIASPSASPTERFRTKSQDSFTSLVRAGHLPLPSRSRDSGSSSTFNTSNHREREPLPSISSTSSLQSSSKRASVYAPSGRVRSGSLGYNPPNFSKRTVINPHIPPQPVRSSASNGNKDIVLAVIGTTGCGKSTVIRKGLSGYGLMEPRVIQEASNASGLPRYIRRTGNVMLDLPASPGGTPQVFEVIEVQVQTTSSGRLKWPQGLPPIDGLIICYDCSNKSSYQPVEGLLKGYRSLILPIMVLGCKADLEHEIDPSDASLMLKEYDTGLIEVSNTNDGGKEKIKRSFEYLLKAILRQRGPNRFIDSRNPASPDLPSKGAPWGESWTHSPTVSSLIPTSEEPSSATTNSSIPESSELSGSTTNEDSPTATSPDWPSSTRNLSEQSNPSSQLPANEQNNKMADQHPTLPPSELIDNSAGLPDEVIDQVSEEKKVKKEPRPSQWADLDDLLDKLLFLAVSGDDPTFATHFLLTHRRFATPRSVLLAMQKRMRQLDNPCGDPMFACFAQMRICNLLETWIRDYPHDFAVKGTAGALNALIKSIISKTHLMHYGTEFLPFLEQLPGLVDQDAAWALKVDVSDNDSDVYTPEDEDEDDTKTDKSSQSSATTNSPQASTASPKLVFPSRERKSSLPLPKSLLSPAQANGSHRTIYDQSPKQHIRDLTKLALEVMHADSEAIAQEITRQGVRRFLMIKARDWLHYTFVHGKSQSIIEFNIMSNHLADWVVSLILCHERPNKRARQIEKFVDIAQRLRNMNNYSALRAFVAGINNANDDQTMEAFKSKSPDAAKNLMSWDVLLQQIRSHRSYRLALRNSKGACIPALEVHMSDLIKAHEGNDDKNPEFPTKIPWGKFNMMGRFINNTLQCQTQCRNSSNYADFPDNSTVAELFVKCPTMSIEMQKSRLKSQDYDYDDFHATIPISQPKDITGLRKIFFW